MTAQPLPARPVQRALIAALVATMVLTSVGCKTSPPNSSSGSTSQTSTTSAARPLTPAEKRLREDEQRMQKSIIGAVLVGAVAAAALCALTAKATGGSANNVRNSALVCAGIGGGLMGVDAYREEKLRQSKRNEIDAIQAAAADVRAENENMRSYLANSSQVLSDGQARLAAMRNDLAAKRITVAEADSQRKLEEANVKTMSNTLTNAKKTRDEYKQAANKFQGTPQQKSNLDQQIAEMDRQVAQLERNIGDYNKALAVSRA